MKAAHDHPETDGPLRLVMVGAGLISRSAHVPAILARDDIQLSGVVDAQLTHARDLCTQFGLDVPIYDDLADAVEDADAAVVATPNHTHAALAELCFRAGLDVLVEKPLASSIEDADRMVASAQQHGRTLMAGFCTRYLPSVQYLKQLFDTEVAGLRRFVLQFGSTSPWSPLSGYFANSAQAGGGTFVTNGSHYLDRLLYWFGQPRDYQLWDDSRGGPEATAVARFTYASGTAHFHGELRISKLVDLPSGGVFEFDDGVIVHREYDASPLRFQGGRWPGMWKLGMRDDPHAIYRRQLDEFLRCVRTGIPSPTSSLQDARDAVSLCSELYAHRLPLDDFVEARTTAP